MSRRVVFITGAGGGAGSAIARRLAADGCALVLAGRTAPRLHALAGELSQGGAAVEAITCDVSVREDVEAAVGHAERTLGPIDVLVNNAAVAGSAAFVEMDDRLWHGTLAVNLTGAYYCMRAVLPGMLSRRHGRILNIASTAAKQGFAYTAAYVASKHGLLGLTRAVAAETQGLGVTINAICPGWLDTGMTERSIQRIATKTGRPAAEARGLLERMNPRGQLIDPGEVADLVARLAAPGAGDINGQDFDIT